MKWNSDFFFFLWWFQLICWFCLKRICCIQCHHGEHHDSWFQNGIKMLSSYLLILYLGIPTSEILPGSVHHHAGTRVFFPGLIKTDLWLTVALSLMVAVVCFFLFQVLWFLARHEHLPGWSVMASTLYKLWLPVSLKGMCLNDFYFSFHYHFRVLINHFKGVLHPRPVLRLFVQSKKWQHIGGK